MTSCEPASVVHQPANRTLTLPFGKFKGEPVGLLLAHPDYAMAIVREGGHADLWRMSQAIEGGGVDRLPTEHFSVQKMKS